ncbi:uncharacterized protein LOC143558325 [Bidens hawaiensis]|uniref:uncharacterized protein LOC143558325 n=1 Tax=Bidens hawaiensis TaxID=980011 RepID=UPI004049627D
MTFMEFKILCTRKCWLQLLLLLQILFILVFFDIIQAKHDQNRLQRAETGSETIASHSCIHDEIIEQRRKRHGHKVYSVTPQVYHATDTEPLHHKGRVLLEIQKVSGLSKIAKQPIRIDLNYDAVGHSPTRDCRNVGDIVKSGEPLAASNFGTLSCNPYNDPPIFGDCWYNCTSDDIPERIKGIGFNAYFSCFSFSSWVFDRVLNEPSRLMSYSRSARRKLENRAKLMRARSLKWPALGQTADWFRRALAVERVRGNLRLSGYSACGQDGGVQLPRAYVEEGVADADLVLLVTTRPTTVNTLAWAVACERDQWGRAIAGHVNVAPRHLTAEAETLLSATLIHEVMHVLGFDPHAFTHFRDERKRRRSQVTEETMDEKIGRMVTRVVLPHVIMHARHHYGTFSESFTGLELEDGGGRGTSGSHCEKRLLMNEIMTGSVDTRSVVSKMTLALLEDSGWYEANYSMADRLDW